MTPSYPNREHENADKAARRRAIKALDDIIDDAQTLQRRIARGYEPHGTDAQRRADKAVASAVNFAFLEQLRDVREWHAADLAEDTLPDKCAWHGGEGSSGPGCPECAEEDERREAAGVIAEREAGG